MLPAIGKLSQLPFSFIVMMMVFALMLGSDFIYGAASARMQTVMFIYAVLLLYTRTEVPKTQHKQMNIVKSFPVFIITFGITAVVMLGIQPLVGGVIAASTLEAGIEFVAVFGVMQAFVKAYIEEEVFRGRIVMKVGEVGQALLFGAFHFFMLMIAFGFSPMLLVAMAWLALLGYIWGRVEDRWGLTASTASHFAYNLAAFGILGIVIGATVV